MANNCYYILLAVSKNKESLERLHKIMNYKDEEYFIYRCFEATESSISEEDGFYTIEISGDCAWSCFKWFESVEKPDELLTRTVDPQGLHSCDPAHYISLDLLCKKLEIGIELYSEESGCCFQEHYHVNHKGEILCDDCVEWHEIWEDDDGEPLDEPYSEGGFPDWGYFSNYSEIYG